MWSLDEPVLWPPLSFPHPPLPLLPWWPQSESVTHPAPGTQFQPCPAPAAGLAFAVYSQEQVHLGHFKAGGRWGLGTRGGGALSNSIPPQVAQGQDGVLGLPSQWRDLSGLATSSLLPPLALPLPEAPGFRHPLRPPPAAESLAICL